VNSLGDYLAPLGATTRVGEPARILVRLWGEGSHDPVVVRGTYFLGQHRLEDGQVTIDVYYSAEAGFVLAHELVEAISDPDTSGEEIADPCVFQGYALVGFERVPRYLVNGKCWPEAAGGL
jgi:hypothetical protein